MKKEEQVKINEKVMAIIDKIELDGEAKYVGRLRTCSAYVYESENFYLLRSYRTFICAIDKATNTAYDFLRYAFGFTRTSAQHITKFIRDYSDPDAVAVRLTYYAV